MSEPPSSVGAAQSAVTAYSPGVAVRSVGAPGVPTTVRTPVASAAADASAANSETVTTETT